VVAWQPGQAFSELENRDTGLGRMPVASTGAGQKQGEFSWLHFHP
jgi:hypothetical protein